MAEPAGADPAEIERALAARDRIRLLEALLFASSHPIEEAVLARAVPPLADISELLRQIAADFSGRGVNLVRVAGGWMFRTAPDLAGRLDLSRSAPRKLPRAALETLAIVAYHQPVTRPEIEEIRGVALGRGTLDLLMEAGWIVPKGRRETPGRPATWVTTPDFLLHFGLDRIGDLPDLEELRAAGLIGDEPMLELGEPSADALARNRPGGTEGAA